MKRLVSCIVAAVMVLAPVCSFAETVSVPEGADDVKVVFDSETNEGFTEYVVPCGSELTVVKNEEEYTIEFATVPTKLMYTLYTYDKGYKKPAVLGLPVTGDVIYDRNRYVGTATAAANFGGTVALAEDFGFTYSTSKTYQFKIRPQKPYIRKLTKGKKRLTIKWKNVKHQCTGYEILLATNSGFTKNVKTVRIKGLGKYLKTVKGLKAKKKYYVKIRAYKDTADGTRYYSKWSAAKTCKTK